MNPQISLAMLVALCLSNASSSSIRRSLENITSDQLAESAINNVTVIRQQGDQAIRPTQDTNSTSRNNSAANEPGSGDTSQQTDSVTPTPQSGATGSVQTSGSTTVSKTTQTTTVTKETNPPTKPTVKQVPPSTQTTTEKNETKPPTKATFTTQTTTEQKETESSTTSTVKQVPPTTQTTTGEETTKSSTKSAGKQIPSTTQTTTSTKTTVKQESSTLPGRNETNSSLNVTKMSEGDDTNEPTESGDGDGHENEPFEGNGQPAWGQHSNVYRGPDPYEHTTSHFAAFFLTSIVMIFAAYVLYHNRQKIIVIIIEGRNNGNKRRRGYRKLETNVEEAMPSLTSSNSTYVY